MSHPGTRRRPKPFPHDHTPPPRRRCAIAVPHDRTAAVAELDRQVATLRALGHPALAGEDEAAFTARFEPLREVVLPQLGAYLLLDVDRGDVFRGTSPEEAVATIHDRGRTPLTVEEGIAVVTHAPHLLERNHCFSLAGSRRGDRRVPALWISAGAPKLGWCWAGNPHDWLGLASAASRTA